MQRHGATVAIDEDGHIRADDAETAARLSRYAGDMQLLPSAGEVLALRTQEPDAGGSFWMSGELSKPGALWDLIAVAGQAGWTGELSVVGDGQRRSLFLEHGALVGASSTAAAERLGEVLVHQGVLSPAQAAEVAAHASAEQRFGEAAVELQLLTRAGLFELIGAQVEEIFFAVMLLRDAQFYFIDQIDEARLPYRIKLGISALLMDGMRRVDEVDMFRTRIPASDYVPQIGDSVAPPSLEQQQILDTIDGVRSVDDIARVSGMSQQATRRALLQLAQEGAVSVHPPHSQDVASQVMLFNRAMQRIHEHAEDAGKGATVRQQLATFAEDNRACAWLLEQVSPQEDGGLDPQQVERVINVFRQGDSESWLSADSTAVPISVLRDSNPGLPPEPSSHVPEPLSSTLRPPSAEPGSAEPHNTEPHNSEPSSAEPSSPGLASLVPEPPPSGDPLHRADRVLQRLRRVLYDYASFAMFIAEPLLRDATPEGADVAALLAREVAELLTPLAPER